MNFLFQFLSNCSKICGVFSSIMGKNDPTQRTQLSKLAASLRPATAIRAAGDLGLMFFLLRMAFWLGIVLILLPTGAQHSLSTSDVDAADALSAASATVHDLKGFCAREPNACTVGSELATVLGHRAQAGAKMLYDFLTEATAPHATGSLAGNIGSSRPGESPLQEGASQNTLIPADLDPPWRGPPVHKTNGHSA
jgi:hypothetical protein